MKELSLGGGAEKRIQRIFEKAEMRKQAGCDSLAADWQAILEMLLCLAHDQLCKSPGRLLPLQVSDEEEWEAFLSLQESLLLTSQVTSTLYITTTKTA